MGFFDSLESMVSKEQEQGAGAAGEQAKVASGLVEAIEERSGGLKGVLQQVEQNGLGGLIEQWGTGQQTTATPAQIEQGLGETGLIERTAEITHLNPEVVKMALTIGLPLLVRHAAPQGTEHAPEQGGLSTSMVSIAGALLGRLS